MKLASLREMIRDSAASSSLRLVRTPSHGRLPLPRRDPAPGASATPSRSGVPIPQSCRLAASPPGRRAQAHGPAAHQGLGPEAKEDLAAVNLRLPNLFFYVIFPASERIFPARMSREFWSQVPAAPTEPLSEKNGNSREGTKIPCKTDVCREFRAETGSLIECVHHHALHRSGLSHALPNCAAFQRFSAAVSGVSRLWGRAGARFPRLSPARLRLPGNRFLAQNAETGSPASETGSQKQ